MTQKRFCGDGGYQLHLPSEQAQPTQSLGQFDARSPQMGPRRYAASRELWLKGIGLQRRYPIWGLRACLHRHGPNVLKTVTYVAGRFCYLCS